MTSPKAWITSWGAGICCIISFFLPLPHVTFKSLAAISVLGIVQVGLSAILFSIAIKRVSAVQANLIAVIEPVFNLVWVFFALGEAPGINSLIGGGIIVLAATMTSIISANRNEEVSRSSDLLRDDKSGVV